jgi:histone acetyltransferase (RNA polymerase elongator complex component)
MTPNRRPKPFVIPIFLPHAGCPHRCVFCDQTRTTGCSATWPAQAQLHATVTRFLGYRRDAGRRTEISFYGGNFLGMAPDRIKSLLELGTGYVERGLVHGLRFSTRPDTIHAGTLELIAGFPVTTVELGVQSMNDAVLAISRRGHTVLQTRQAVALLRNHAYRLGLQMMIGLPGDTPEQALVSGARIAALNPDFVRIYPTLVLAGSLLARWYAQGRYAPLSLAQAVDLAKGLLNCFGRRRINVIRLGLQPTDDLNADAGVLAGPFHPAFGELAYAALWQEVLRRELSTGNYSGRPLEITLHPALLSRVRGHKNQNIKNLISEFRPAAITTRTDPNLPLDRVLINGRACPLFPAGEK